MSHKPIVVIEDNIDFASILKTVLHLWGYAVQHYDTIGAGSAAIDRNPPSLLILDGQLPDGDGFQLYSALRQRATTRRLPILLLSVSDDVFQTARAASDADPLLFVGLKPMPLDEIQTIVERVISA